MKTTLEQSLWGISGPCSPSMLARPGSCSGIVTSRTDHGSWAWENLKCNQSFNEKRVIPNMQFIGEMLDMLLKSIDSFIHLIQWNSSM